MVWRLGASSRQGRRLTSRGGRNQEVEDGTWQSPGAGVSGVFSTKTHEVRSA